MPAHKAPPIDLAKVEELAQYHLPDAVIFRTLGVSHQQWHREKYRPESGLMDAIERGRARIQIRCINRILELMDSSDTKAAVTATIFTLKNLCGWRDRQETTPEHVPVRTMTDDEVRSAAKSILEAQGQEWVQ